MDPLMPLDIEGAIGETEFLDQKRKEEAHNGLVWHETAIAIAKSYMGPNWEAGMNAIKALVEARMKPCP